MADFVYETPKAEVGINWGKYIRDGKVTEEGEPIIKEAMQGFYKGILSEIPNYFNKKEQ
jgi:hypothetical protein